MMKYKKRRGSLGEENPKLSRLLAERRALIAQVEIIRRQVRKKAKATSN